MNELLTAKEMSSVLRLSAEHGMESPVLLHQVEDGNYALWYLLRGKSVLAFAETADYFRGFSAVLDPGAGCLFDSPSADFVRGFKEAGARQSEGGE